MNRNFSWWWPSSSGAHWAMVIWLILTGLASIVLTTSVTAGFVNAALWYLMIIAGRFVYLQARKARSSPPQEP